MYLPIDKLIDREVKKNLNVPRSKFNNSNNKSSSSTSSQNVPNGRLRGAR